MRVPRRHIIAARSSTKVKRQRSQLIATGYVMIHFSAKLEARRCMVAVAARPIPPAVENTRGVKVAISTSQTHCPYCRCFTCSCLTQALERLEDRFDCTKGWKTLTSKNVRLNSSPYSPDAQMSRRASFLLLPVLLAITL